MSIQREEYLKKLLETVPHGFFVDAKWLAAQGISRALVTRYVKSGWLLRVAHGLYRRPTQALQLDPSALPDWETLVLSMQRLMGHAMHVGGSTALRKHGHGHYVPMGRMDRVFVYAAQFPGWLKSVDTNAVFELRNRKLFAQPDIGLEDEVPIRGTTLMRQPLILSAPERAVLEAIKELPDVESFHTVDVMFEALVNLRPRRIMALLEACASVQVKRLFFVFADRHNHAWRKHVDAEAVDLGSGDRSFVKGGKLHPRYRITIPDDLMPAGDGGAT